MESARLTGETQDARGTGTTGADAADRDDTDLLRRHVARLRDQGAEVEALADRLLGRLDAAGWTGRAADSMRERVTERVRQLRRAADRHALAADALAAHHAATARAHDEVAAIEARAARMVAEARTRVAALAEFAGGTSGITPDHLDEQLLAFEPPPPGHHAWLEVDLPGLER